jgi:hypothetical protein
MVGDGAAAECPVLAEATIVDQNKQDVGRALRCRDRLGKLGRVGIEIGPTDLARKMEIRPRQHIGRFRNRRGAGLLGFVGHRGLPRSAVNL